MEEENVPERNTVLFCQNANHMGRVHAKDPSPNLSHEGVSDRFGNSPYRMLRQKKERGRAMTEDSLSKKILSPIFF